MERRFREMARYFLEANLIRASQLGHFGVIMKKAGRWQAAKWPLVLVVALVLLEAAYMLKSGRPNTASWAGDATTGAITVAGYYSALVTHTIFLGLLGLILWRWLTWLGALLEISKLDLQLDPTDGDLAGGLGFLGEIPKAFMPVLLAISAVIGASWRAQVLAGQIDPRSLVLPAGVLAVLAIGLFLAPLLLFTPKLLSCKRDGTMAYATLRHLYSLQFRKKWVEERRTHIDGFLGSGDLGALSAITSGFRNVEGMSVLPFRKETVLALIAALAIPLIPVATTEVPLKEVLKKLLEALH